MAANPSNLVIDALEDFSSGLNSGIDAFALPKNQLSFAVNATVRGNFVTSRPPFQIQNLPAAVWQTINSVGIFQGACYCAPDSGQQFLIAQIGGRLFTFTPDVNDLNVVVQEVTIPGDPNPSNLPQAWLFQAERWVIINNGVNLPIFYDSGTNTSRRSLPVSSLQATTNIADEFYTPAIGGTVVVTLDNSFANNIAAFINQSVQIVEYDNSSPPVVTATTNYEVVSVQGAFAVNRIVLQSISYDVGATQLIGSSLVITPSNLGNCQQITQSLAIGPGNGNYATLDCWMNQRPVPSFVKKGDTISIAGNANWTVTGFSAARDHIYLQYSAPETYQQFPPYPDLIAIGNTQPNVIVGTLAGTFTNPDFNTPVSTILTTAYVGLVGQTVFINGQQYQVVSSSVTPPVAGATTVTLLNLNDDRVSPPHVFNDPTVATATEIWNFPELPPGRMGAYTQGRVGMSLTDAISYILGDIVGGSSGSPAYNYRDAVLKTSESTLLANGGAFNVPSNLGQITAMCPMAQADASLGQGPLMIVTPGGVFSFNGAPDRTTWATQTSPPLVTQTLIGLGGLSQNSTIVVNGDMIFRAVDGIRSLIMAKREFYSWGNTPISFEMNRVLNADNVAGLPYASAVQFDNRLLMTCIPTQGAQGVYHQGLIALNFDPVSSLAGKASSVYDGLWTGINVLQIIEGQFSGVHRCFAFTQNTALGKIELYEILKSGDGFLDNGSTPIVWSFETPVLFKEVKNKSTYDLCALEDCEFYVKDIQPGTTVDFKAEYRPDFSTCWFPWHGFTLCNDKDSIQPLYGARLGLGKPTAGNSTGANSTSSNFGRWFQQRYTISGHCIFMGEKITASLQPQAQFAKVISTKPSTPVQSP